MARSCIYCGKTLGPGEKCSCRTTGQTGPGPSSKATAHESAGPQSAGPQKSNESRSTADGASGSRARPKAEKPAREPFFKKNSEQRKAEFRNRLPGFLALLRSAGRYVMAPVESIQAHVYRPDRRRTIGFHLFQAVMAGFALVATVARYKLTLLSAAALASWHPLALFLTGAVLSGIAVLLLSSAYVLLLKYGHRKPFSFGTILTALAPASLYTGIFLLFAAGSVRSAPLSAVMMLLSGQAVGLLAQFFAMRQQTAMEENRLAVMVLSASVLASSVFSMILGGLI